MENTKPITATDIAKRRIIRNMEARRIMFNNDIIEPMLTKMHNLIKVKLNEKSR